MRNTKKIKHCRKIQNIPTSTYILIFVCRKKNHSQFSPQKSYFPNFSLFLKSLLDAGDGDGDGEFEFRVNFAIFRHTAGGAETIPLSKYSGSKSINAKIADVGPPGAPQYFFRKKSSFLNNMPPDLMRFLRMHHDYSARGQEKQILLHGTGKET